MEVKMNNYKITVVGVTEDDNLTIEGQYKAMNESDALEQALMNLNMWYSGWQCIDDSGSEITIIDESLPDHEITLIAEKLNKKRKEILK